MKSYAVDSLYAFIIVVVVFLVLPFFVSAEQDAGAASPVGEYSIEEEKPEIFTRIIDRVSSFYRLKRNKKHTRGIRLAENNFKENEAAPLELDSSADKQGNTVQSTASALGAAGENPAFANQTGIQSGGAYFAEERAELNGQSYRVLPDPYGNKYVMVKGGPVPLNEFLKRGGRIVKPSYGSEAPGAAAGDGAPASAAVYRYEGNRPGASGEKYSSGVVPEYKGARGGKIKSFQQSRTSGFIDSEDSERGSAKSARDGSDVYIGGYDFNPAEQLESLRRNMSAKRGSPEKAAGREQQYRTPKVYKLQNSKPFVSDNSIGVAIDERGKGISLSDSGGDDSEFSDDTPPEMEGIYAEATREGKEVFSRDIEADYDNSSGIIPDNEESRRSMSGALLRDPYFIGKSDKGWIKDPWILPNAISSGPGKAFFGANRDVLLQKGVNSLRDWEVNDRYYENVRSDIAKTTKGAATPLIMLNGQKTPYTMSVMPQNSYYYKVASGLLNDQVRQVDDNGEVDLNKIDREKVLVVVPETPLAENLKKDGYKVAIFDKYLITPGNLKNFYDQTSAAVKDIEESKKAEYQNKKQDISLSLKQGF